MLDRPIKFAPYLKTVIWGGNKIAKYKSISTNLKNVGESWEISAVPGHESVAIDDDEYSGYTLPELIDKFGATLLGTDVMAKSGKEFPLLIKIIDAQRDLSVQVHPNDTLAYARHKCPGKTEMWYIIDHDADAKIFTGLSKPLDKEKYMQCIADNSIMDAIAAHKSEKGQFFFVPAGTLHAIGAGNLVAEIQQTSDITYRVYDYDRRDADGNPRELHTELAKDAINYQFPQVIDPTAKVYEKTTEKAVDCDYFTTDYIKLDNQQDYRMNIKGNTFAIVMVIDGEIIIKSHKGKKFSYNQGTSVLIPAEMQQFTLSGKGTALVVHC